MEAARRPSAAASAAVAGILGRGHDSSTPARRPLSVRRARSAELDTMWVSRWAEAGGQEPVTDSDTDPDPEALPDSGKAALLAPNAACAAPGRSRTTEPPADTARRWVDVAPPVAALSPMGTTSTRAAGDESSLRRMDTNPLPRYPVTLAHLQRSTNPAAAVMTPLGAAVGGSVCPLRGPAPPPAVLERRLETLQTRLQMLRQRLKEERQALALTAAAKARAAVAAGSGAASTQPLAGRTGLWGQRPVLAVPRPGLLAPPPSPLTPSPEFPREQPPPPPPSSTAVFDPRAYSAFSSEHFRGDGVGGSGSSSFGGRVRIGGRLPPSSSAPFSRSPFAPPTYPPLSSDVAPRAPTRRLYDRFSSWNDPEPFTTRYVSPCSSHRIFGVTHVDYAGVGGEATADADPFQAALRDAAQLCAQEADRLRAAQRELSLLSSAAPVGGKGGVGGGGGGGADGGGGYTAVRSGLPPAHWLRRRILMQPNNVSGSMSFAGRSSPASAMPPPPIHRGGPSLPSTTPLTHTPMPEATPLRLF